MDNVLLKCKKQKFQIWEINQNQTIYHGKEMLYLDPTTFYEFFLTRNFWQIYQITNAT